MSDHYHDQVRKQLEETRQALKSAEDELAVHRQRARQEDRLRAAWRSARRRAADRQPTHPSAGALMAQVQQLGGQLKTAERQLDAARALHRRVTTPHVDLCAHCSERDYPNYEVPWPCLTIRALDGIADDCGCRPLDGHDCGREQIIETVRGGRAVVDTCHTVTVDGDTIRVRGASTLGPAGEAALAEVIRAAKRRYAAEQGQTEAAGG
jgi:hypothetical protein